MKTILNNILGSFNNISGQGWAARKLTAFAFMMLVFYIHYKYVNIINAIDALMIDSAMILLLLGLVTFEQILQFKNDNKKAPENTEA